MTTISSRSLRPPRRRSRSAAQSLLTAGTVALVMLSGTAGATAQPTTTPAAPTTTTAPEAEQRQAPAPVDPCATPTTTAPTTTTVPPTTTTVVPTPSCKTVPAVPPTSTSTSVPAPAEQAPVVAPAPESPAPAPESAQALADAPMPAEPSASEPVEPDNDDLSSKTAEPDPDWTPTDDPNATVVPGQMRSDREEVPAPFTKEDADRAETLEAKSRMSRAAMACQYYWPSPHAVCGVIRDKYNSLGGPASFLSFPNSPEYTNPDGYGKRTEFLNGPIYWSAATGAHPVVNSFLYRWGQLGYESAQGMLGYPTTDEIVLPDGGRRQEFQRGVIYVAFQNAVGSALRNGLIRDKYNSLGGLAPGGTLLGYPIQDPVELPDGGRMNRFERGVIYWSPTTGAHEVAGLPFAIWSMRGYEQSQWGYPTGSPEMDEIAPVAVKQQFQGGMLDAKALFAEAGNATFNGKLVNSLLIELLQSGGVQFPPPSAAPTPGPSAEFRLMSLCPLPDSTQEEYGTVSIPSDYDFWGCLDEADRPDPDSFPRHDYCSSSPDQYPTPGQNAVFEGACARHDMCMDEADLTNNGYNPCNRDLHERMDTVCESVYSSFDPRRYNCRQFADAYWVAVTGTHLDEL